MTRFDVARTQQPKSTVAYSSLRFGLLRYQLKRTTGMVHKPDNSECSRQPISWFAAEGTDHKTIMIDATYFKALFANRIDEQYSD